METTADTTSEQTQQHQHPIRLVVSDDLQRNRLTVFFRLILAIPLVIWLVLWGLAVSLAVLGAWIVGLITGPVPGALGSVVGADAQWIPAPRRAPSKPLASPDTRTRAGSRSSASTVLSAQLRLSRSTAKPAAARGTPKRSRRPS